MIAALALALAAQGGGWAVRPETPTVGDTVRLERLVPAPVGAVGRAHALAADELIEPLAAAEVRATADGLRVRYTVAFFQPGRHAMAMPALEVVHPDGEVELVLGDTAWVAVGSVLPDTAAPPAPRAAMNPLGRPVERWWPTAVLVGGVVAGLVAWGWVRRRRRPTPAVVAPAPPSPEVPFMRWLGAGERRAVATLAADRLRARLAEAAPDAPAGLTTRERVDRAVRARPDWPAREVVELLGSLERARFAPLAADDLAELVDRAHQLVERLDASAAAAEEEAAP